MDEPKLPISRKGNGADSGAWVARVAVIEQRLKDHDEELVVGRTARETYIPKIIRMEQTLDKLSNELIPKLTNAVDGLTAAVTRWNTSRTIIIRIAAWSLSIVTALALGVISAKLTGWIR